MPAVLVAVAGIVAIVGLTADDEPEPAELASDAPTFTSLAELVAASDLVVVATVTDISDGRSVTAPDDPAAGLRTRLVRLSVARTLVGQAPRPLVVEEPAALIDGTPVVVDGLEPLAVGEQPRGSSSPATTCRSGTTRWSTRRAGSLTTSRT